MGGEGERRQGRYWGGHYAIIRDRSVRGRQSLFWPQNLVRTALPFWVQPTRNYTKNICFCTAQRSTTVCAVKAPSKKLHVLVRARLLRFARNFVPSWYPVFPSGTFPPQWAHPIWQPAPTLWCRTKIIPSKEPPRAQPWHPDPLWYHVGHTYLHNSCYT